MLHQNDLIDALVFPSTYISSETFYSRWPVLRSRLLANRLYMNQVIARADEIGAGVFLEVKELSFPEQLIELKPDLLGPDGAVCPTHPFWTEYLGAKTRDLFELLPGIEGIVVSLATRESKASIATGSCECERCLATDPQVWYEIMIRAMHGPMAMLGKTLVVRDFAYSAGQQGVLVPAAKAVSNDIVMALKNVPHDFWPTFPDNPLIGHTDGLRQWIEYDVFGQYVGLGIVPCDLLDDIRSRLEYSARHGAEGVILRTDWELIDDTSVFNSLNEVNAIAASLLAADPSLPDLTIHETWVTRGIRTSLLPESSQPGRDVVADPQRLIAVMADTWPVLREIVFTRDHVFQFSSKVPGSLDDMLFVAHGYHGREQWDPGSSATVAITSANLAAIVEEKDRAFAGASGLRARVEPSIMVDPDAGQRLVETFDLLVLYADLFRRAIVAAFAVAVALDDGGSASGDKARVALDELSELADTLPERLPVAGTTFYIRGLLNPDTVAGFAADLRCRLKGN
ncbi:MULTISPECIES: hypothetical protein [unclassified Microbacterium]|uniref:hypothetical protein n=1 Tax=unclassified Microbacterium TaxID=2609290 RepID=UPI00214C527F|nr:MULTISPECIES: hypothetical protein [unclassified Microbacterium]MCR2811144.1 hypothetical protein [Microbacterium sp. zg.B185]WIM20742.1 hypothetical protein QNO12_08160 [Microbacterium sp. zg-B185]